MNTRISEQKSSEQLQLGPPPKQGLYDPQFEHDACGLGFVVNVKGRKAHQIVTDGLQILVSRPLKNGLLFVRSDFHVAL